MHARERNLVARRQCGAADGMLSWRALKRGEKRMTTFDKRKDGFEKEFAHEEELRFKAMARRNKMLGLWAAGLLGKTGTDAEAYAKEVVLADFEEAGDNDVLRKVVKDLAGKADEAQVRAQMQTLLAQAIELTKKTG
jgi:hypothetical protein